MLPASSAGSPAARARWPASAAVVLLPFVPVTPITRRPPRSASHSEVAVVTWMPRSRSAASSGLWIETPGERTTTSHSASRASRPRAGDDRRRGVAERLYRGGRRRGIERRHGDLRRGQAPCKLRGE